ncbi:hypothetical protein Pcinc_044306 [Petrolisthes cinctipes]|uniref:Uncharacterized protein n=1 Tax=Petrolisthes cinctipes TaxID=88211 RepID=A0AAE1BHD5_PETCI|nr:hypothetical protein Pcinc_044306 [Petrolisthes cinctipes]
MSRFVALLVLVLVAFGVVFGAEEGANRLEGDAQLVNVDSQKVQQVVVLPGAHPTTTTKAGDEPLDMNEENMDAEGVSDSEEMENYLTEEDEAEEKEESQCQCEGEEQSDVENESEEELSEEESEEEMSEEESSDMEESEEESDVEEESEEESDMEDESEEESDMEEESEEESDMEEENEEDSDVEVNEEESDMEEECEEDSDNEEESYLEDEETDLEEKEESEESERHEEGEEDNNVKPHTQEPLVNVDAREVHQVVVATPSHEKKMDWVDREPLKATRPTPSPARRTLDEVMQEREEMNRQLIDLHHKFLAVKPRTLRNPMYKKMLKEYCSMLEARIKLEKEYLDLDEKADDNILRMLEAHHKKLTHH